jgi:hypothetical protein
MATAIPARGARNHVCMIQTTSYKRKQPITPFRACNYRDCGVPPTIFHFPKTEPKTVKAGLSRGALAARLAALTVYTTIVYTEHGWLRSRASIGTPPTWATSGDTRSLHSRSEAFRQNCIQPLSGGGLYDSPQAVPNRDCLRNERRGEEEIRPANRLTFRGSNLKRRRPAGMPLRRAAGKRSANSFAPCGPGASDGHPA